MAEDTSFTDQLKAAFNEFYESAQEAPDLDTQNKVRYQEIFHMDEYKDYAAGDTIDFHNEATGTSCTYILAIDRPNSRFSVMVHGSDEDFPPMVLCESLVTLQQPYPTLSLNTSVILNDHEGQESNDELPNNQATKPDPYCNAPLTFPSEEPDATITIQDVVVEENVDDDELEHNQSQVAESDEIIEMESVQENSSSDAFQGFNDIFEDDAVDDNKEDGNGGNAVNVEPSGNGGTETVQKLQTTVISFCEMELENGRNVRRESRVDTVSANAIIRIPYNVVDVYEYKVGKIKGIVKTSNCRALAIFGVYDEFAAEIKWSEVFITGVQDGSTLAKVTYML